MFPIEQSAFLQALGYAIGNSLWQVASLWLLYAVVNSIFKLNPSRKYQLATLTAMVGFIWFTSTLVYHFIHTPLPQTYYPVYTFTEPSENAAQSTVVNQSLYFYHSVLASLKSLSPYISCAYLLVFLTLGVRLVNGFRQVKFFGTQGLGKVAVQWRLFVQENAQILQIKHPIKVFTSIHIQSPITMGFWKPIILLPLASLNNLSTKQVEAILLHELAHIHRHDYLINIFVQIVEISLFFNPFMRLLLKQIKQERENCCDDYVLQFKYSATDYAKALLAIEKNNAATLLALSAKNNQSFQLLHRVKRMVAPQPQAFNYKQQLYMLLLLTILGLGFTVIVPKPTIKTPSPAATNSTAALHIKKASISNTTAVPTPPAFDLIKTIQGITNIAQNIDVAEIEAQAQEIGEAAEDFGRDYGKHVERAMQPYLKDVEKWAQNFSINEAALAKIEADAKNIEAVDVSGYTNGLSNLDTYIAPLLSTINEAFNDFPKINIPRINMPRAAIELPIKTALSKLLSGIPNRMAEEKIRIAQEKISQLAALEKSKIAKQVSEAALRLQYEEEIRSAARLLEQQQAEHWQKATEKREDNNRSHQISPHQDQEKNVLNGPEDADLSDELRLEVASKLATANQVITYAFKLPKILQIPDFVVPHSLDWIDINIALEKQSSSNRTPTKIAIKNGNQPINTTLSDALYDSEDLEDNNLKSIIIKSQRNPKNTKAENVIHIKIAHTR